METKTDFEKIMAERFTQLPPSVQAAITSADVEEHLRGLAKTHQLHLDQWDLLENEVMLTLLGLQKTTDLKDNIVKQVGVTDEVATALANDIAQSVFQPIRTELEHQINQTSQPETPPAPETLTTEATTTIITTTANQAAPAPTQDTPATEAKRPAPAASYLSNVPSHERRGIEGDPYREQIV